VAEQATTQLIKVGISSRYAVIVYIITQMMRRKKMTKEECEIETSKAIMEMRKHISELEKENEKLKKRCNEYEMRISQMEKGSCDACKENEKDRILEELEKEAEEYAKQNNPAEYGVRATHFTVLNSFKDGAEFGYNKANEWHYVKNGDLPKTHGWYFVCYNNDTFDCVIVTKDLRFLNFYTSKDMTEAVYAWKEIVFPKEEVND
jgi:seryl-tRNA synthetase